MGLPRTDDPCKGEKVAFLNVPKGGFDQHRKRFMFERLPDFGKGEDQHSWGRIKYCKITSRIFLILM